MKDIKSIYTSSDKSFGRPLVIAGPCSAETEEQILATGHQLAEYGIPIFRAGVWKPRTKPGGFEGVGEQALFWMEQLKKETGLLLATEVATSKHVELALKHGVEILWIGARTTTNPFAIQEVAEALQGVDISVMIKNPVSPDLNLWIGGIERLYRMGIRRLAAIHRGFNYTENTLYRNYPLWHIPIELKRQFPQLQLICDPSHMGGRRDLILKICQQAMDLNFDGLIIETHNNPDEALSDSSQQITSENLKNILSQLIIREPKSSTQELYKYRQQIDEIDTTLLEILSRRMNISREIGRYKEEHQMAVLHTNRYEEILERLISQAEKLNLSPEFIKNMMEVIHEESVRQQMEINFMHGNHSR